MNHLLNALNARRAVRLTLAGIVAALLAGCSSDATRLANPFSNPFAQSPDTLPTGSLPRTAPLHAARVAPVTSRPLASAQAPKPFSSYASGQNVSYNQPQVSHSDTTGTVAPRATANSGGGNWSADGGTPIVAAQGETAPMLAQRFGVPQDALLRVNGFSSGAQVQPGTRLIVPVYNAGGSSARPSAVAAAKPAPASHHNPQAAAHVPPKKAAVPAKARLAAKTEPKKDMADKKHPAPVKRVAEAKPAPTKVTPVKVARVEKAETIVPKKPNVDATPVASLPPHAATASANANPEFRWPARGRIIQGFKAGGNDGINIAVPEGTSVKAAEGGVVAYAGSELKGYGNLVLIRHPNGFVSAYANNGDIEVKRGDNVKRGQTIAKSGQSGNVSSPQLHFELRKGSTPVDPTSYLAGL